MKRRLILAATFALGVAFAVNAQKIVVDVDNTFDFAKLKTFVLIKGQIAPNPMTSQTIVNAIESELMSRGLVRSDTEPDIQIAVMAAADMDLQGVGPSWNNERYRFWGGYGNPSALMTLTKGTLLIDLVDTKGKLSVWRGVAKGVLVSPPSGDPARDVIEMKKLVDKTIGKMFRKYPVKPRK